MARKSHAYTNMGSRVAQLAKNQEEIADVLGLTQQSVSGKLRGDISFSLDDLSLLSKRFGVPVTYFFALEDIDQRLLDAWNKILEGPEELRAAFELASSLPREFSIQLLTIARAMEECLGSVKDKSPE